ncbi:MAG: hypothetical protein LBQ66_06795, partial [Planctomycetaceae bacterium]|nr:hypothetical protein [Planctomycetaceae bacterium]
MCGITRVGATRVGLGDRNYNAFSAPIVGLRRRYSPRKPGGQLATFINIRHNHQRKKLVWYTKALPYAMI